MRGIVQIRWVHGASRGATRESPYMYRAFKTESVLIPWRRSLAPIVVADRFRQIAPADADIWYRRC